MRSHLAVSLVACSLSLVACGNKSEGEKAAPASSAQPAAKATGDTKAASVTGNSTSAAAVDAPPQKLPEREGRSPAPTLAEWNSQQKEVTVKGSSALKCETKIVREYLRVACHGKNDTGGTPTNVVIKKGGKGEAFTYVGGGIATLVVPFVEGIDFSADFSWTDKSHTLNVVWPKGSKRPEMVGVFEGAKSPLSGDGGSNALADKLCGCHKKVTGEATCDNMIGGPNPDCDRTYGNDCQALLECSRMEPGRMATCLPGYVNAYVGTCYKRCETASCPDGYGCEDAGFAKICVER